MSKIIDGYNNGINAANLRENQAHPGFSAWDRRSDTLRTLVNNSNDYHRRLASAEAKLASIPFPFGVRS